MLGCIIAGFGFSNANLGLVHGIAHTLSAHFHLAHGMANATVLPYVMEYNADGSLPEKMVELARAIHLPVTGNVEEDKYLLSPELLKLTKELGIKTLSQQGIEEKRPEYACGRRTERASAGIQPQTECNQRRCSRNPA